MKIWVMFNDQKSKYCCIVYEEAELAHFGSTTKFLKKVIGWNQLNLLLLFLVLPPVVKKSRGLKTKVKTKLAGVAWR